MAIKHRKLFPNSPTNQTGNCPDVCDPTCPYDCYPYPDFDYIPPPPLGPPPLSTNKAQHISPYVILIVSLLASLFLLVSYYAIIVKYCSGCSRFTRRIRRSSGPDEESLNEIHGPTIDHPIWYIATIGLQSSVINSITIFKYKRSDNLIEGSDCSVCLNEFQEDETLRLLPKCNHAFHISCIDTWLRSHTNCPLCRAQIIPNFVNADFSAPTDQTSNLSVLNEQTHMENEGNDGELDTNRVRNAEDSENRAVPEDGNGNEIPQVDDERKEIENFKQDLGSNIDEKSCNNDMVMEDDKVRQVRKSFSVDFDSIGDDVIDFSSFQSEGSSGSPSGDGQKDDSPASYTGQVRIFGKMGGSSIEESLHKRPVTMKRSFSYSGRSFLARQHRSHNATIPV